MPKAAPVFQPNNYFPAKHIQLVFSGNAYFDKLVMIIRNTHQVLYFQTYIFDDDATGGMIADELKQAAKRGVKIYMLLDAFGSKSLSKKFISSLEDSGIFIRFFAPVLSRKSVYLGRRLHHKIIVSDDTTALIGGINIADKYRGTETVTAWLDYAVLINGAVCKLAADICFGILNRKFLIASSVQKNYLHTGQGPLIRFRQNDYLRGKKQISASYMQAIKNAQQSIIIIASYFLPGQRFLNALKKASLRGVEVKIILSANSDVLLFNNATAHLYASLLKAGVQLYEWEKSVLHGKIAMVDHKWITIGSFNLNYLSAFSSIELNVETLYPDSIQQFQAHVNTILQDGCKQVIYTTYQKQATIGVRLINGVAYYLTRAFLKGLALFPRLLRWSKEE